MKKVLGIMLVMLMLTGCAGLQQVGSRTRSSIVGLRRTITLYNNSGTVIRTWETKSKVSLTDYAGARFFDINNKAVFISGTFVVEEK